MNMYPYALSGHYVAILVFSEFVYFNGKWFLKIKSEHSAFVEPPIESFAVWINSRY